MLDRSGCIVACNASMIALLAQPPSLLPGTSFDVALRRVGTSVVETSSSTILQGGWQTRQRVIRERRYAETTYAFQDALGAHAGAVIILANPVPGPQQLSEERLALQPARELNQLRLLLSASSEGVVGMDADGRISFANEAAATILGMPTPALVGRELHPLLHQHPIDQQCRLRAALRSRERQTAVRDTIVRSDGMAAPIEYDVTPIVGQQQRLGAVFNLRQAQEKRHLEEQLRQAQKMETLGRLAGGAAHDFNNLLTVIIGYSELALGKLAPDDAMRGLIEEIKNSGERATMLTRQLLGFSRKQVVIPRILDLNELLANMERMLRRLIGEDVDLQTQREPALWRVEADPSQLELMLMNLVVNARDAMPKGGKLRISTTNTQLNAVQALDVRAGEHVLLTVTDTGCGMDQATLARIFEPFFTTKTPEKGTGLGLAMVREVVTQCHGYVDVSSQMGLGTTFRIYLPRAKSSASAKGTGATTTPHGGHETIMLVEDDDCVRSLSRQVLLGKGYHVLEACNGAEAIATCARYGAVIHLLVTDVVMPNMSGRQLADPVAPRHQSALRFRLRRRGDRAPRRRG